MAFESSATTKKPHILSYDFNKGSASGRNGSIKETDEQSSPAYTEPKMLRICFSLSVVTLQTVPAKAVFTEESAKFPWTSDKSQQTCLVEIHCV